MENKGNYLGAMPLIFHQEDIPCRQFCQHNIQTNPVGKKFELEMPVKTSTRDSDMSKSS